MSSPIALLLTTALLAVIGAAIVEGASVRVLKQNDPRTTCDLEACDAVARRDPNTLKSLIDAGRTTCFCTCNTRSLVSSSVFSECKGCIDHLIAPPSSCSITGLVFGANTALHQAAGICQIVMGDHLLKRGADPNRVNRGNNTPLCIAAMQNDPNCGHVVRSLIKYGADACKTCGLRDQKTPLELAVNDNVRNVLIQDGGANC